jgi:hypothetical protein
MLKTVKFKSPESPEIAEQMAEKVQLHFYDVTRDKNELKFHKFDEQAFNCVIALEGFNEQDYFYIDNELCNALFSSFVQLKICIRICTETVQNNYTNRGCCYNYLICNKFQSSENTNEIFFVITPHLIGFINKITNLTLESAKNSLTTILGTNEITKAVYITDDIQAPSLHILKIERKGKIELYHFFPIKLEINLYNFHDFL